MSRARTTALAVALAAAAWGGPACQRDDPQAGSPVVVESAQEKADKVQAAFAPGAEVDDAEVEAFVDRLQAAVRERDVARVSSMIALGRMLDGVEATTGRSLPPMARKMAEAQIGAQIAELFDPTVVDTKVKRIERDARGNIVVYLRMIDGDRVVTKSRWWLYHDGEGLKWWDAEDLQLGMRMGTAIAAGVASQAAAPGNAEAIQRFIAVISQVDVLTTGDRAAIEALAADLEGLRLEGIPASFRHLALAERAITALVLGDPEAALRHVDALEAEPLEPLDMPVRHYVRASASLTLGRNAEAVRAIERWLELLGEDAEAYHMLGVARLGLGEAAAAMAAFDQGIAEDPRLPENYGGAAMATDDASAVVERLRKAPDEQVIGGAADWLVAAEDREALTRFLDAAKQAWPSWDQTAWRGIEAGVQPAAPN